MSVKVNFFERSPCYYISFVKNTISIKAETILRPVTTNSRTWRPRRLRRGSAAAQLLGLQVYGEGLQPLSCWDCRLEHRRRNGCVSVESVVFGKAEFSASVWLLVQSSLTECSVSKWMWPWSLDTEEALAQKGLLCRGPTVAVCTCHF